MLPRKRIVPGIDAEHMRVWAFSGGGLLLSQIIQDTPVHIRAIVACYAELDLRPYRDDIPTTISDEQLCTHEIIQRTVDFLKQHG